MATLNDTDDVELHEWLSDACIWGYHATCRMGDCECDCHAEPAPSPTDD